MVENKCTPAPSRPSRGTPDWADTVHGNCFSNIQRLGHWIGGTTQVASGEDPSSHFKEVKPGSLGDPLSIYVVTHGWAAGFRSAVDQADGDVLWWGSNASAGGIWTSDWAWAPVVAHTNEYGNVTINETGMLQSIVKQDPTAVVLAYSWIDDSATDDSDAHGYRSEAYTQVNGIRLANALKEAIGLSSSFWTSPTASLTLIGHSHGSKVVTVAAVTLRNSGFPVARLAILDSPESNASRQWNSANFLGFYLKDLDIVPPTEESAKGTFVDNYASYFGVSYSGAGPIENIVQVSLTPSKLYWFDMTASHVYAAAWFGGAAAGADSYGKEPLGLAWPPLPKAYHHYTPALVQTWPQGPPSGQWQLDSGPPGHGACTFSTDPLPITSTRQFGNVHGNPSTGVTLGPGGGNSFSIYAITYQSDGEHTFGVVFDLVWVGPQTGDYLVVSAVGNSYYTLLVMDGKSLCSGKTLVAINADQSSSRATVWVYFLSQTSHVTLSDFRSAQVRCSGTAAARPPLFPPAPPVP